MNNVETGEQSLSSILDNDEIVGMTRDFNRDTGLQTLDSFLTDFSYSFLTSDQKKKMLRNHVESHVLGLYIQMLTGISLNESRYLFNEQLSEGFVDEETKNKFKNIVTLYVQGIAGKPLTIDQLKSASPKIKSLLDKIDTFRLDTNFTEKIEPIVLPGVSRSASIEITEDIINFIKLYTPGSLLMGGKTQSQRITSPKVFERIFNLAVDPDDFEIDVSKTLETNAGTQMYAVITQQGLLQTPTKFKNLQPSKNIHFNQYFVTISTVGAT